jgi:[protein-PII] uridylyltransferase
MLSPKQRPAVTSARERLASGRAELERRHNDGQPGIQVCAAMTDLLDGIVLDVFQAALADDAETNGAAGDDEGLPVALVAHGGFGRRDVAPYSDVDLMLLHAPAARQVAERLARRLTQDICDASLQLGFSLRTASEAIALAKRDAKTFTSLTESRLLTGSRALFDKYMNALRKSTRRRRRAMLAFAEAARRDERRQFTESVYLLEPNVKRSRGALRGVQLARWVGFVMCGETDLDHLSQVGLLSTADRKRLREAHGFLLRLRNELHFHAGRAYDVLDKAEQIRIAELRGYKGDGCLLPVEQLMRDYFELTSDVRYIVANFLASARFNPFTQNILAPIFTRRVEGDFRAGPHQIGATRKGLKKLASDPEQVLRLMKIASRDDKRIDHPTWQAIRKTMSERPPAPLSEQTIEQFLAILSQSGQLCELLRRLHELRVLEQIIPAMAHARCLLQFNEYHKYTVDEHTLRAIQRVTDFQSDTGPLGDAYRTIRNKRILHLAVLLHDLGKGYPEDHSEVGLKIAAETAQRLLLSKAEGELLKLLVHKHLYMSHLAFRRDLHDPAVAVQCAVDIGSPEALQMLYVLTCADLAAVGPGVLNDWKVELITGLYQRAMRKLAGDELSTAPDPQLEQRRHEVRKLAPGGAGDSNWWDRQIEALPPSCLAEVPAERIVAQLRELEHLPHHGAAAWGYHNSERKAMEYVVGAHENLTPGIFHKLTGVLSSQGHQILGAEIDSLADGLVLDRFYVTDLDFTGEPPAHRVADVVRALIDVLTQGAGYPPKFRQVWKAQKASAPELNRLPTQVRIDNSTATRYTIIDVFAHDRVGLLYAISHTLFKLGLSVSVAKIATYLDQVVDVFYVTDQQGMKIEDPARLEDIRRTLLEAIEPA